MSEDYIRPPIVALELPSQRAAIWRFRIITGLVLLLLALAIVLIVHAIAAPPGDSGGTVGLAPARLLATLRR